MIAPPPTIPQARAVLAHYAPSVQVEVCKRNPHTVTCTGSQGVCVYHGKACVPVSPIRYHFTLWRQGKRIVVGTYWDASI